MELIGYVDVGYLSNPHKTRSQTCYSFSCGDTPIYWLSVKQTLVDVCFNHAKIITIHEAIRECFWLRNLTRHIHENCGLTTNRYIPIILNEHNAACIIQFKKKFIK